MDGKALRRSFEDAAAHSPAHLLQAFAAESGLTLAQEAVDAKVQAPAAPASIRALPRLPGHARPEGQGGGRRRAARAAGHGGGGGAGRRLPTGAEGSQGTLHEDVKLHLDDPSRQEKFLCHRTVEKGHGRVERRAAAVCHDVGWLLERYDWPGLRAIGKVAAERRFADGSGTVGVRYCLLSAKMPAARFAHVARAHWAVENADAPRPTPPPGARRDDGRGRRAQPQGQRRGVPRRHAGLALDIARAHPAKISMRRKFIRTGLSFVFLLEMLGTVRRGE